MDVVRHQTKSNTSSITQQIKGNYARHYSVKAFLATKPGRVKTPNDLSDLRPEGSGGVKTASLRGPGGQVACSQSNPQDIGALRNPAAEEGARLFVFRPRLAAISAAGLRAKSVTC